MYQIEAKKEPNKSERGQFFYSMFIICATSILEAQFIDQKCNQDLALFTHLVFYGFICFGVYNLIGLIPRGEHLVINLIYLVFGICFSLYIFALLIYGFTLYLSENDCLKEAPVLYFFLEVFVLVNGIGYILLFLLIILLVLKVLFEVFRR